MRFQGWIFDAYLTHTGVSLRLIDAGGRMHSADDPWQPRLFVKEHPRLARFLSGQTIPLRMRRVERTDLFTHRLVQVREIRVKDPLRYNDFVEHLQAVEELELFNCDIHLIQAYHYERRHFPLARGEFEINDNGLLLGWTLRDSPWELDYELPPFRYAYLSLDHQNDPNHARRGTLKLTLGDDPHKGTSYLLEETEPAELLESLNNHIAQWDPDVILSDWGDSYILPRLALLSKRARRPLKLSRDPDRGIAGRASRSFFTYGRTVYQGGAQYLFGRWHLDMQNSFTLWETGLDGLFEIARIAKLPVQRAARCTIGTSLSSMQLDVAEQDGVLVPLHKQQTEDFRDGLSLVAADKGGIVYVPELGWHEGVGEVDFVSMYPAIMVKHNISPETVNCGCCSANKVPEIGHHLCRRRRGLVPRVLENILFKRGEYKRLAKTVPDLGLRDVYKRRYTAHKWALVTCFGYLGFKNARFGKIEAHECVSAYGRDILLQAKDIAEANGYHMVHAIVDSLWVKKPGATESDYRALVEKISRLTEFPLGLEGVYKWLCFVPSKKDPLLGVPNRYFGCFTHGELKVRGIELRRQDTPLFFKDFQQALLACLSEAGDVAGCKALAASLKRIYDVYRDALKTGQVPLDRLAFTSSLSKEPSQYVHDTYSSIAARQLAASGVTLHAGETIQYVITSSKDKVKDWRVMPLVLAIHSGEYDPEKYLELFDRAYETITGTLFKEVRHEFIG